MTITHTTPEEAIKSMQRRIDELQAEIEQLRQTTSVEGLCVAFDRLSHDDQFELARYVLTKIRN